MQSLLNSARHKITRNWAIFVSILLIAAFFRFYRLTEIPPGLNNDEAFDLLDLLNVLKGQFSIFFAANTGREPLWFYLNTATVAFFGANAFALRFTAAIIGTATVGLVWGFARDLFRSTRIAALAALFAAISVWHIFYSRYGLRIILAVPLTLLALWWFWRAVTPLAGQDKLEPPRAGSPRDVSELPITARRYLSPWRDFGFAGVCTALALYTYISCRLLPFALILLTAFAILFDRTRARVYLKGLLITGLVAAIIFLPLGAYFVAHPDDLIGHSANLSIFDPRVNDGNIPLALWNNTVSVVGMFLVMGDHQGYRNVPNRPVFDPFAGAFFVLGAAVLLVTLVARRSSFQARLRAFLLALWMAGFLLSSIASDDAPSFLRTLPAMPAAMMMAACGVSAIWNRLRGATFRRVAAGAFGLAILASAALGFRDYFDFGNSGIAYLSFDTHVADAANWIVANASTSQVYLAPLWAQQGTMRVITRNLRVRSYESRDTVILPSASAGQDAVTVYPWEQDKKAQTLGTRLGALGVRTEIVGAAGFPVAVAYRVSAKDLPDSQNPLGALARGGDFVKPQQTEHAVWANNLQLIGYSVEAADAPKRNLEVTLFLHVLQPMPEDDTFSIKVRDAQERTWGQEDKWPGDNSYATSQMAPGDLVIEKFYPGLNACAPAGEYHITVELYNPKTGRVVDLSDRAGNAVSLGTWRADSSQGNRPEDLEIDQNLDLDISPQMHLLGYNLTPDELRAGERFSLSLFWRGLGNGLLPQTESIHLRDAAGHDFPLVDRSFSLPPEGRGLCDLLDLSAPADAAAGKAQILANNTSVATLSITR